MAKPSLQAQGTWVNYEAFIARGKAGEKMQVHAKPGWHVVMYWLASECESSQRDCSIISVGTVGFKKTGR